MKNKGYLSLLSALLTIIIASHAHAYSFDITTNYAAGDPQAVFNLYLNLDESANEQLILNDYTFEFVFDNQELTYNSYSFTPPSGLQASGLAQYSVDQAAGTINGFAASPPGFFDPGATMTADFLLGSFTFDVTSAKEDGLADFNFDYGDFQMAYVINDDFASFDPSKLTSNATDIRPSAVPVPSALLLLGSGILGLAGLGRRKA